MANVLVRHRLARRRRTTEGKRSEDEGCQGSGIRRGSRHRVLVNDGCELAQSRRDSSGCGAETLPLAPGACRGLTKAGGRPAFTPDGPMLPQAGTWVTLQPPCCAPRRLGSGRTPGWRNGVPTRIMHRWSFDSCPGWPPDASRRPPLCPRRSRRRGPMPSSFPEGLGTIPLTRRRPPPSLIQQRG